MHSPSISVAHRRRIVQVTQKVLARLAHQIRAKLAIQIMPIVPNIRVALARLVAVAAALTPIATAVRLFQTI